MTNTTPSKQITPSSTPLHRMLTSPLLMVLVAFALRLGMMAYMESFQFPPQWEYWKFGFETGRIARSIASGQGFSSPLVHPTGATAWVPPVYPYLLAGIFRWFGVYSTASAVVTLSLNSLFSALTCLTVVAIGRKTFGPTIAVWAGWGWAFSPYAVFWSVAWVWAISLSALLLSLVILVTLRLERCSSATAWLGYGLLWGLIALTDTALLSVMPLFIGWLCYRLRRQGMALRWPLSAFTLAVTLSVSPWLVRNYLIFGELVFIRSNLGVELHVGNYEGSTGLSGGLLLHPAANEPETEKLRQMGELRYVAESQRQALDFIRAQPGTFLWLTGKRVLYFWTGTPQLLQVFWLSGRFAVARYVLFALISALAFFGLFLALRHRNPTVPLFATLLIVFPVVYYVTHTTPRYRHPIEPAMVVLAAYALANAASRTSMREQGDWRRGDKCG